MKDFPIAPLVLVLLFLPIPFQAAYSGSLPTSSVGLSGSRQVPLTIKIVFMGLTNSDINATYLTSQINTPSEKSQTVLAGPQNNGVTFKFTYQISYANSTILENFRAFLKSFERNETTTLPPSPGGFRNPYFDNSTTNISTVVSSFYNASKVEGWLSSSQAFGPDPVPGYTLFVADLHNYVPSMTYSQYQDYNTKCLISTFGSTAGKCASSIRGTASVHYYNRTVTDPDLKLLEYRHFMTAWGGNHRFYFLDLSAGPSYWTNELPLQVAAGVRSVGLTTQYGRYWSTQFIADYLVGVVYNLFAPDQIYPVNYSAKYNFHLFVFDNRTSTEMASVNLRTTINETMIRGELSKLVPYANVSIITKYANLTSSPGLAAVVATATTKTRDPAVNGTIIDARLVYNWLSTNGEGHITQFINVKRTTEQLDIPAFIFAFTGNYNFGFTFKSDVFLPRDPDTIYGAALGDLVLISHGQRDLTMGNYLTTGPLQPRKGIGYTRTIIHELGHEMGLAHPFSYDVTEDFVDSVMGYYANSLTYSQFDRDMVLRGVNDELLLFAQVTLANTTTTLFNSGRVAAARQAMLNANQKYSMMDYADAVSYSLSAALEALQAHLSRVSSLLIFSPGILYGVLGLVVGAATGLVAGYLAFRRRTSGGIQYYHCPTCQQTLRWDPAMMRWYCDHCQKPV